MLSAFEIEDNIAESTAENFIDAALYEVVNHREEVRNKRNELITSIFQFAKAGCSFTQTELFSLGRNRFATRGTH